MSTPAEGSPQPESVNDPAEGQTMGSPQEVPGGIIDAAEDDPSARLDPRQIPDDGGS